MGRVKKGGVMRVWYNLGLKGIVYGVVCVCACVYVCIHR